MQHYEGDGPGRGAEAAAHAALAVLLPVQGDDRLDVAGRGMREIGLAWR